MTRVLALDHGSVRCGMALSDPSGTIAVPIDAVERPDSRRGVAAIARVCTENGVGTVVIGLPLSLDGREGAQAAAAREFAQRLGERLGEARIELFDERLTTVEAVERGGSAAVDSRAAAVLLERWLESNGRQGA